MASYTFVFLLLSALYISAVVAAQQRSSNIGLGSSLSPSSTNSSSSWLSPSGTFAFGFYPKGNGFAIGIWFAQITQHTVVWTSNRDDPPLSRNATLLLTSDGRLILQDTPQGKEKSIADDSQSASWASMLDTGNFVLYNSTGKIIWQSFDSPTDTLLPGQRLVSGKELFSSVSETDHSTGIFMLSMQSDGNLVQYPNENPQTNSKAYWASGTYGQSDNVTLNLDDDGHLYLLNNTGFTIYNLFAGKPTNRTVFYRVAIDVDGIIRVYSIIMNQKNKLWSINWESPINKCEPKGICGFNAYCTLLNQTAICNCIPGFSFKDESLHSLGCELKINNEGYRNNTMSMLENTVWEEDLYYAILSSKTERDCKEACLADKYCEATSFQDQKCRKLSFPLRYGRRTLDRPTTPIFVKVSM
ncbi:G-type lectin S-receptor-like serine/threonine-protein kinase LECRK3 [Macadamia integrifolia]|uniref:G-type lectin S-receptor-like serine/threonine-protein kinase LECRK3 n=1 Tax=Macadamia integrifolia TaxID=60698 RepID=UPI001C4E414A|nr:G-type lectin S-receptor-like serine/threonine-protein kinase LECRK3 [Macadamia integrifolia]